MNSSTYTGQTSCPYRVCPLGAHVDHQYGIVTWLCRQTDVYAMEMPGARYDIGDIRSYEEVQSTYKGIK